MAGISPVGASSIQPFQPPVLDGVATSANSAKPSGFAAGLDSVAGALDGADAASSAVATGQATDLHQMTVAATKAELMVGLTVAVRDKAVEAYQDIMRMPV